MNRKYEYKFVKINPRLKSEDYQPIIQEHAREGWRLVQVFAPGAGGLLASPNFCDIIFEREVEE